MSAPETDRRIGPEHGRLIVRTSREGFAAAAGHDLTIELATWSGRLRVGVEPAAGELTVTVDMGSMRIVDASGGLAPLTEREKVEILRNARSSLSVGRYPEAEFVAEKISDDALDGTLTLRGRSHPLRLTYRLDGERYRASGTVRQSDHGVTPFSAFFGALKLADDVRVEVELNQV